MKKSTIAVVSCVLFLLAGAVTFGQIQLSRSFYFPHIADGIACGSDAIRTQITIVNTSDSLAALEFAVFDNTGRELTLTFRDLQTGDTTTRSRFTFDLPRKQMVILETPGTQSLRTGWMWVTSNTPIAGTSAFSFYDTRGGLRTTVGVGASYALRSLAIPIVHNRGQAISTGFALVNISTNSDTVDVTLFDALTGREVARTTLNMGVGRHVPMFADELFPDYIRVRDRFEGTMYITTRNPNTELSAVALLISGDKWTSYPVVELVRGRLKQGEEPLPAAEQPGGEAERPRGFGTSAGRE